MKRVALLKSAVSRPGGLEKYATRIADAFARRNCTVTLLTTGAPPARSPVSIATTPVLPWPAFWRLEQYDAFVRAHLKRHPADLIFGMDRNRHQTHIRAGNGVHAAYLDIRRRLDGQLKSFLCRVNPLHLKILELEKAAFENPALETLFVNSHLVRNQVLRYYRTDPAKIIVLHNGVEWTEMALDAAVHLPHDRHEFLFIGNGYRRKGLEALLRALAHLPRDSYHLSVVGKDREQPYFERLAHNLPVTFHGLQSNIRPFYQRADTLVIPSYYDPFANVTVEALAMGLFVVTSRMNGGHEILSPAQGAIIDDLFELDSVLAALHRALQHPKTAASAAAIRASVQHRDFPLILDQLMEACGV